MSIFKTNKQAAALDANDPVFYEYRERFSKKPVLITCDMNFRNTLPNGTRPFCVKVQMQVYTDPSNPNLVNDIELQHLATVRTLLGDHIGARFVGQGIVGAQNMAFIMYYLPERMIKQAKQMLSSSLAGSFRHTDYTITYDPNGEEYMKYLYPNTLQIKQVENGKILSTLNGYGDDGTTPRKIMFHITLPSQKAATEFYTESTEKEFLLEGIEEVPAPEGLVLPRHNLTLSRELPFDIELLDRVDEYLLDLCEKYEGIYTSLETDIVSPEGENDPHERDFFGAFEDSASVSS